MMNGSGGLKRFTAMLAVAVAGGQAIAQTDNLFLPLNGYWENSANWSLGHVPQSTHHAIIPGGKKCTIAFENTPVIAQRISINGSLVGANDAIRAVVNRPSVTYHTRIIGAPAPAPAEIPDGFEIVELMQRDDQLGMPAINVCGQIVFYVGVLGTSESEIILYDNGTFGQVTNNDVSDQLPDINDTGTIVWIRGYDGYGAGEVVLDQDGETRSIGEATYARLNNLGHLAWHRFDRITCASESVIYFHDGKGAVQISGSDRSNQGMSINDFDDVAWTRYDFCVSPWTSEILLHQSDETVVLTDEQFQPQGPQISNNGRILWASSIGIELWEDGATTTLIPNAATPKTNNHDDIFFLRGNASGPGTHPWLFREGVFFQLIDDTLANQTGEINDWGEIAWNWFRLPNVDLWGLRFLRRIRTGEADFDGDIDRDDYAVMQDCQTGPIETDGLCNCRFLDIDHNRTIDLADYAIFQNAYTGP